MSKKSAMHRQISRVMSLNEIEKYGVRLRLFDGSTLFVFHDEAVNERYSQPYKLHAIYWQIRTVYDANSVIIGRRTHPMSKLFCTEALYPAPNHQAYKKRIAIK
ncbi:hypothetical protein [Sporolactobacillus sp. KGMB 08714]|uniref:hypothetical protein n=1 Tax=Sporolactobacillus sp. KGMB 08714 TaxID=3064704 RepID=UPI002FBDBB34